MRRYATKSRRRFKNDVNKHITFLSNHYYKTINHQLGNFKLNCDVSEIPQQPFPGIPQIKHPQLQPGFPESIAFQSLQKQNLSRYMTEEKNRSESQHEESGRSIEEDVDMDKNPVDHVEQPPVLNLSKKASKGEGESKEPLVQHQDINVAQPLHNNKHLENDWLQMMYLIQQGGEIPKDYLTGLLADGNRNPIDSNAFVDLANANSMLKMMFPSAMMVLQQRMTQDAATQNQQRELRRSREENEDDFVKNKFNYDANKRRSSSDNDSTLQTRNTNNNSISSSGNERKPPVETLLSMAKHQKRRSCDRHTSEIDLNATKCSKAIFKNNWEASMYKKGIPLI